MTLSISFDPAIEAKLREEARATGKAVEQVVREAVEARFRAGASRTRDTRSPEERLRRWQEFVSGMHRHAERNLPPGYVADDSRDSIYAGRGE